VQHLAAETAAPHRADGATLRGSTPYSRDETPYLAPGLADRDPLLRVGSVQNGMSDHGGNATELRVALAGYGLAGAAFHAPLVAATEGLELAAVVTRSAERRAELAEAFPEVRAVDALGDALEACDVVVIASPNRFHAALAREAIAAGKHVVIDKPVAVTAREARELRDAAVEAGVVAAAFHNRRWDDDFLTLRRELDAGRFGRVVTFESRFDRWRPVVKEGAWRENADPADGGGLLLDLGSHLVDQAIQLFGAPATVYAELDVRREGAAVEDDVFIALEHPGGVRSHLIAGVFAADAPARFRVLGERGALLSYGLDGQEPQLRAGLRPGDPGWAVRETGDSSGAWWHDGSGAIAPIAMEPGAWDAFYPALVRAIRSAGSVPPPVTLDDAITVLDVLEAARTASTRGTVVALG
jgi:scyllo-inositol 2-dehydrogenase (NADP+)